MPYCMTRYHGEVEYPEEALVRVDAGLPGFENETEFLLIEIPSARPIVFLQSVLDPELCFVTLPVYVIDPSYDLVLSAESLEAIDLSPDRQPRIGEDVLCLTVLTIQEDGPTTANLMAPVVMNLRNRLAVQAVREDGLYSHRHVFLEEAIGALCS